CSSIHALSVHHAVKIDLHGEVSDHAGVGAEVLAFIGSDVSLHQVLAGENYLSQNSSSVIIGSGEATMIDSLVVNWPSGWKDVFYNVPADADYYITEGETFQVSLASSDDFLMCAGSICNVQVLVSDAMFEGSILWSAGNEGFYAQVGDTGNYVVTITNVVGLQRMLSFTVNLHETPYVQTSITAPLCHGQSTAACELISDELAFVNGSEFLSSLTLTNLNTGAHTFSLVDVHGCASTLDVTIPETPAMSIAQSSIAICANATEIAIPEIYNATPPLDIEWWNEEEEDEEEQFEIGEYELMVTDFHGCEASFAVFVDHYSAVQLIVNADTACAGETSAYTWQSMGATQVVWASVENNALDELPAGTYTLLAEDEHGCLSAHDFTIHDFAPIEIELSLDAMSNELQAAVSGGVEPYTWEWGT
ncbi:MAG: ASPIC/UnbV domain-containing protein, partial [Flavobacteriales bacterium]